MDSARTLPGMRRLLYVNSALVLVIGIPLSLLSDRTDTWFAWTIHPPLTAAVLGAGYWASFVLELRSAREPRWARTRVARAGTWGWLLVDVSVPVAMSWLLVAQQRRAHPDPARVAPLACWVRILLRVQAAVMVLVGVAMLLVPTVLLGGYGCWKTRSLRAA